MTQAIYSNQGDIVQYVATAATEAGEVVQLADGRVAVAAGQQSKAIGDSVTAYVKGQYSFACATATVWADGDKVFWDNSANLAVIAPAAGDDWLIGTAIGAKASGPTVVLAELNPVAAQPQVQAVFTTQAATLTHDETVGLNHDLMAAAENHHGMVLGTLMAEVIEAPAGSSQDQMIVTLYDEDDNALATLTTTNTTPDAAGDLIQGSLGAFHGATGTVLPIVPADKGCYVEITQTTAGTPAGVLAVRAIFIPRI